MTVQELIDELSRVPAELRASVNGDSIESVTYTHGELLINV